MSKVSFANLKLKTIEDVKEIDFNGAKIEVKQYLPISDKYDLIMITLQQAYEDRVYNPLKIEAFFHLNLIYLYTNINFTDKQKENPEKLYDILQSNKIIDAVVEAIPREEFCDLYDTLCETRDEYIEWNKSAAGMLSIIVDDLPKKAAAASELLSNFNTEDYKEVIRFAQAANADRPIPTLVE